MSQTKAQLVEGLNINSSTPADSLVIDSSGNVGIGQSNPSGKLEVSGGFVTLRNGASSFPDGISAPVIYGSTGGGSGTFNESGNLVLQSRSDAGSYNICMVTGDTPTERLRIDSSGNVGISNTTPASFQSGGRNLVVGANSAEHGITIYSTTSGNLYFADGTSGSAKAEGYVQYRHDNNRLDFGTSNSLRMSIDSSGNVGIGTSSPQGELHLHAGDANGFMRITNTTTGSTGSDGALFQMNGNDLNINNLESGNFIFHTADTERMRIDSSGNVQIGTSTSNNYKLHLRTAGSNSVYQQFSNGDTGISGTDGFLVGIAADKSALLYQQEASPVRIFTNSAERMRIDSSGNVGINQVPTRELSLHSPNNNNALIHFTNDDTGETASDGALVGIDGNEDLNINNQESGKNVIFRNNGERMRIDSSGNVGIGTTTPTSQYGTNLNINDAGSSALHLTTGNSGTSNSDGFHIINSSGIAYLWNRENADTVFATNNTERMRIDSSGRAKFKGGYLYVQNSASGTGNTDGLVLISDDNADKYIWNYENTSLRFGTNNAERMRLDSSGNFLVGKSDLSDTTAGLTMRVGGVTAFEATVGSGNNHCMMLNRQSDDGTLILFRQNNTSEGAITVSGSTVSYGGGHLARWSQLPSGAARTEILRGSVLSNLDEMCEWGEEDNEQLNRMKVSDVEGDVNVSGVFQAWDDNDDTYVNDFYCAMTGDFVIRIAQGTTVARGDLLMSAGDGTAKPQDDDIVRSTTIAKVTSTTVSTTYSDNSYCVPCVLMAC